MQGPTLCSTRPHVHNQNKSRIYDAIIKKSNLLTIVFISLVDRAVAYVSVMAKGLDIDSISKFTGANYTRFVFMLLQVNPYVWQPRSLKIFLAS